jgi:uncharacterized protein YqfA (UPF0365 family)
MRVVRDAQTPAQRAELAAEHELFERAALEDLAHRDATDW